MSIRLAYSLGFFSVVFLLLISFYLEYVDTIIPCQLCSVQRLIFCILCIFFFTGIFLTKELWQRLLLNTLITLTTILGMLVAGRQIWIQHFPLTNGSNDCSVSFAYLIETFPLSEVIRKILLEGGNECSKRGFEFLHFTMAEWAFIWFLLFLLLAVYLFLQEVKHHHYYHH